MGVGETPGLLGASGSRIGASSGSKGAEVVAPSDPLLPPSMAYCVDQKESTNMDRVLFS